MLHTRTHLVQVVYASCRSIWLSHVAGIPEWRGRSAWRRRDNIFWWSWHGAVQNSTLSRTSPFVWPPHSARRQPSQARTQVCHTKWHHVLFCCWWNKQNLSVERVAEDPASSNKSIILLSNKVSPWLMCTRGFIRLDHCVAFHFLRCKQLAGRLATLHCLSPCHLLFMFWLTYWICCCTCGSCFDIHLDMLLHLLNNDYYYFCWLCPSRIHDSLLMQTNVACFV